MWRRFVTKLLSTVKVGGTQSPKNLGKSRRLAIRNCSPESGSVVKVTVSRRLPKRRYSNSAATNSKYNAPRTESSTPTIFQIEQTGRLSSARCDCLPKTETVDWATLFLELSQKANLLSYGSNPPSDSRADAMNERTGSI